MTPARILLISAAIGGGHVAAAKALEATCRKAGHAVEHVDLLDYTALPFRRLYRQAYFDLVRSAPEFVDWLGRRLDGAPSEHKTHQARLRARLTRLISLHLPRLIARHRPDVIVHTHFLAPEILSTKLSPDLLRLRGEAYIRQAVVVTDFFAHSYWLQPRIWRYFVACEEVAVHLRAVGVDPERIRVTGIPIDPRFEALPSQAAARARLGLHPERDQLLVMAGGMDARTLARILSELKALRWPAEISVICGRSPDLLRVAHETLHGRDGLPTFHLHGFSDLIPEHMAAADLLIGKPGGLTASEALAAGLPFAIVNPYPIQEEANSAYLLEHGAALRLEPLTLTAFKLRQVFEDPARRARMSEAALRLGRRASARAVLESLVEP